MTLGAGGLVAPALPPYTPIAGALGSQVAFADLNNDGLQDLVMSAPDLPLYPSSGSTDTSGHVYVVFGSEGVSLPSAPGDLDLKTLACSTVLDIVGGVNDRLGQDIANAGDLDGDGIDDLIMGAPDRGPNFTGAAYILWGAADLHTLPPTLLDCRLSVPMHLGGRITRLSGFSAFGGLGTAVAGGVDLNSDGRMDVALGAPLASTTPPALGARSQNGTVTVVYGQPALKGTSNMSLGSLTSGQGTVIHGADDFQLLGQALAGLGRFDPALPGGGEHATLGDDLAMGAPGTSDSGLFAGAVFVLRGVAAGSHTLAISTDSFGSGAGSAGLVWLGEAVGDQLGLFVGSAGDLFDTGDGFVELLAGAPLHDGLGRSDSGAVYVLAGRRAGVGPSSFPLGNLATVGAGGGGEEGLRIVGPVSFTGNEGLTASPVGDFNGDGLIDLAIGLPGATVSTVIPALVKAGTITLVSGALLQPPLDGTVDLASLGANALMRVSGETAGSLAGAALAVGDHDNDGHMDLAIGAPVAPSDKNPLDPSGKANSKTGRGHVLYGPLVRVGSVSPASSWVDGPLVNLSVFNLTSTAGLSVQIGGKPASIASASSGQPGLIQVATPVPDVPGSVLDVTVNTPALSVTLPGAFSSTALSILTGPNPTELVPGVEVTFTGVAFSNDVTVMIHNKNAPVVAVDPLAGTLTVTAPNGVPDQTPLDITISGSNGSQVLTGVVNYLPFVVLNITPITGRQDSGVFSTSPGLTFQGQPAVEMTFDLVTSGGVFPPNTRVEIGSNLLGWKEASIVAQSGDQVTVELPFFYFGPTDTLVDLRVNSDPGAGAPTEDVLEVTGVFTYLAGDFTEYAGTATPGLGALPPRLRFAGDFIPSGNLLVMYDQYDPATIVSSFLVMGIERFEPPVPFKGGFLGVNPLWLQEIPGGLMALFPGEFPFDTVLNAMLEPEGASIYAQLILIEKVLPADPKTFGMSEVLGLTVRFP